MLQIVTEAKVAVTDCNIPGCHSVFNIFIHCPTIVLRLICNATRSVTGIELNT